MGIKSVARKVGKTAAQLKKEEEERRRRQQQNRKSTDTRANNPSAQQKAKAPKPAKKQQKTVYYRSKDEAKPVYKNPQKAKTPRPAYYSKDNAVPVAAETVRKQRTAKPATRTLKDIVNQANKTAAEKPVRYSRDDRNPIYSAQRKKEMETEKRLQNRVGHTAKYFRRRDDVAKAVKQEDIQAAITQSQIDDRRRTPHQFAIGKDGKWSLDGRPLTQETLDRVLPFGFSEENQDVRKILEDAGYKLNTYLYQSDADKKAEKNQNEWIYRNWDKNAAYESGDVGDNDLYRLARNRDVFNEAKAAGDTETMARAHAENERIRAQYGYSGGAAGDQQIRGEVTAGEAEKLSASGKAALSMARVKKAQAVTEEEIAAAEREEQRILKSPEYQSGWSADREGFATTGQAKKADEILTSLTKGAFYQAAGNTGVEIGALKDMAKYAGSEGTYDAATGLWDQVGKLWEQLDGEADEKKREQILAQIEWIENRAEALAAEQEKWQYDPVSPFFDQTSAYRVANLNRKSTDTQYNAADADLAGTFLDTSRKPTMWDEWAAKGDEMIAGAEAGMNGAEKFLADLYVNALQMVPTTVAGLIPGIGEATAASKAAQLYNYARKGAQTAALAQMALSAGGGRYRELEERGIPYEQARADSLIASAIEMGTESVPLHYLSDLASGTNRVGKTALGALATASAIEGAEEGIAYSANALWSWMRGYGEDKFSFAELGRDMLAGGIMGGLHAGLGVTVNKIASAKRGGTQIDEEAISQYYQERQAEVSQARVLLADAKQWHNMIEQGAVSQEEGERALSQIAEQLNGSTRAVTRDWIARQEDILDLEDQMIRGAMSGQEGRAAQWQIVEQAGAEDRQAMADRMAAQEDTPEQARAQRQNIMNSSGTRLEDWMDTWRQNREAETGDEAPGSANPVETAQRMTQEALQATNREMARRQVAAQAQAVTQNEVPQDAAPAPSASVRQWQAERLEDMANTMGTNGAAALRTLGNGVGFGQGKLFQNFTNVYNQALSGKTEANIARPEGMTDAQFVAAVSSGQNDRTAGLDLDILKARRTAGRNRNAGVDWRDSYVQQMDRKTARTVDGLAKALGVKVVFADYGTILTAGGQRANADIQGNVVSIEKNNPNPVRALIGHELTHRMQDLSPESYRTFREYAMSLPGAMNALEQTLSLYQNAGAFRDEQNAREMAMDEVAADFAGELLENSDQLREFIRKNYENRTLLEKIRDAFREIAAKLTGKEKAQADEAVRLLEEAIKGAEAKLETQEKGNKNTAQEGDVRDSISPSFRQDINEWARNGRPDSEIFILGSTGPVLQGLGAIESDIYLEGEKINTILREHPEMTLKEIKRIPELMEDPVLVLSSQNKGRGGKQNTRLVLFGAFKATNGEPVMSILDLRPVEKGFVVNDMQKVNSTYTKTQNPVQFVQDSEILHADKKRTVPLLRTIGFQMPIELLQEGSIGSISYKGQNVNLNGESFSSVVDLNPKGNGKTRFSLSAPVEETDTLVALHNLNETKMGKALDLGGFPMPSIAVTRKDIPHTNFGDISLVMSRDTVDPKKSRKNTVYSADAWTPTFPAIAYEADSKVAKRLRDKYYALYLEHGGDVTRPLYSAGAVDAGDELNRWGGEAGLIEHYRDDTAMMKLYLVDTGKSVPDPVMNERVERMSDGEIQLNNYIVDALGKDFFNDIYEYKKMEIGPARIEARRNWWAQNQERFNRAYAEFLASTVPNTSVDEALGWLAEEKPGKQLRFAEGIATFLERGPEKRTTTLNMAKTNEAIRKAADSDGYDKWLHSLFDGLEKSSGIYNNKDIFTPSGNRRTFKQTHYPVTLENIVKAMAGQNDGSTKNVSGFHGIKTLRAGTAKRFKSIKEMHELEGRLQHLTPEEAEEISDALSDRMTEIIGEIYDKSPHGSNDNYFIAMDSIGETLMEVAESENYTIDNIVKIFGKYQYKISNDLAQEIKELLFDTSQMPVNIFEAKPERAVRFDEVLAAVVPFDMDAGLRGRMEEAGMRLIDYEKDNEQSRMDAVNSVEGARFSIASQADAIEEEYQEALDANDPDWQAMLVQQAAFQAGYTTGAYHGSPFTDITVFNTRSTGEKPEKLQLLFGTHFTQSRDFVEIYAKKGKKSKGTSWMTSKRGKIYDVYLDLGKSLDLRTAKNYQDGDEVFALYQDLPAKIRKKVPLRTFSEYDIREGLGSGQYINTGDIEKALQAMPPKDATNFLVDHGYNSVEYMANYNTGTWDNNRFGKDPSIIMLDPERIKSADPVTYDDDGNVIPLSERFNERKEDIRYSLDGYSIYNGTASYTDERIDNILKEYGGSGNYAQGFVTNIDPRDFLKLTISDRTLAKWENGLDKGEFPEEFFPLDREKLRNNRQTPYLRVNTATGEVEGHEGRHRMLALAREGITTAPVVLVDTKTKYSKEPTAQMRLTSQDFGDGPVNGGYEVVVEDLLPTNQKYRDQIKETYGNEKAEVRFSLDTGDRDAVRLMRENQLLREKLDYWKSQVRRSDRTKTDPKEVRKLAKELAKDYSTTMDTGEIADRLQAIYDGIGRDWSYEQAYEAAGKLAREMIEQASETEDYLYNEYEEMRKHFRETPIILSPADKKQITDYNEWRKAMFGKVRLQSGAQSNVDQVFKELSELWPEWFDEQKDSNSLDQLERIAEVLDSIYAKDEVNPYADDMRTPAGYLAAEIMDRFWDVPTIKKTYADRAEERLGREVNRRLKMQERYQETLRQVREQRDAKLKAQKEKYLGKERAKSVRQREREMRAKIQRHVSRLSTKLTKATDTQHIPEDLRKPVAAALDSINLASKNGKPTKRTEAFHALQKMYRNILEEGGAALEGGGNVVVDPALLWQIDKILDYKDTPIANLGMDALQTIWDTVRAIEASVSTYNKALGRAKFATILEAAEGIRDHLGERKDRGDFRGPFRAMDKLLNFGMLTPEEYFSRLGKSGTDIFKMLRAAQDEHITIMRDAQKAVRKMVKGSTVKRLEKETHTFDFDGQTVTLTTAQIMSLYELMKRQQAVEHIRKGGMKPESVKGLLKDHAPSEPWHLTQDQIKEIVGTLTEDQVKLADDLQKYMGTIMAELGNKASREVYGYRKFTEKHYFPITVDKNETRTDVKNDAVSGTIAGWGSAKPLNPNAGNALVLRSVFDVFADHATEMANYAAWLAPMENMNRILNFRFKDENGNRKGGTKRLLERAFGKNGEEYWKKLQNDLNNGVHGTNDNPFQAFIGAYKASSIGANLRVIAQQPTAILRALNDINPADFVAGIALTRPTKYNRVVKEYAPIATWKSWGYFTADTGRQMRNVLFNDDSGLSRMNEALMAGAGAMDSIAWSHIWNALEVETRRKRKDLKPGTEAFYQAVAERFNDVIDRTQVVDGILQRSQIMRSTDTLTKIATSFMAEPTKVYNMFLSDIYDVRNTTGKQRSAAMTRLARTSLALAISLVANAAAQSLIDALRDDDKDEKYWEKFLQAYFGGEGETRGEKLKDAILNGNLGAAFNPANYIPFVKDFVSMAQGYKISRMDMDAFQKIFNEIETYRKAMGGESKMTKKNATLRLTAEIARLLGVPAANLKRDIMAGMRTFFNETGNHRMLYEMETFLYDVGNSKNLGEFCKLLLAAERDGDTDAYNAIRQDMIDSGVDAEKLDSKMNDLRKKAVTDTEEYQTAVAQKTDAYATMLEHDETYQSLPAEDRENAQSKLGAYAEWESYKGQVELGAQNRATFDAMQAANAAGINPVQYVVLKSAVGDIHNATTASGETIDKSASYLKREKIEATGYDLSGDALEYAYDMLNVAQNVREMPEAEFKQKLAEIHKQEREG